MRYALLFGAAAGLAAAAPKPQIFDDSFYSVIDNIPEPTTNLGPAATINNQPAVYSTAAALKDAANAVSTAPIQSPTSPSRVKRDGTCDLQPDGYGPTSTPDTAEAFLADPQYQSTAASAPVPDGYTQVFSQLQGATQQIGYLGLYTLQSYDTAGCAAHCNSVPQCMGFNLYFERDPKYDPGAACANGPSITNYKCTLYGYPISPATATNVGQWRGPQDPSGSAFHVVISGSNAYNKVNFVPPTCTNFTGPVSLPAAIQAPNDPVTGKDTYMGMTTFTGNAYDPCQCATYCQAQSAYDGRHPRPDGTFDVCTFFNSYILNENTVPTGMVCSFYTRYWDPSYAINSGQWRGSDRYDVVNSDSFTLNV